MNLCLMRDHLFSAHPVEMSSCGICLVRFIYDQRILPWGFLINLSVSVMHVWAILDANIFLVQMQGKSACVGFVCSIHDEFSYLIRSIYEIIKLILCQCNSIISILTQPSPLLIQGMKSVFSVIKVIMTCRVPYVISYHIISNFGLHFGDIHKNIYIFIMLRAKAHSFSLLFANSKKNFRLAFKHWSWNAYISWWNELLT